MCESSSLRRVCRVLGVSRARFHKRRRERVKRGHRSDALLVVLRALEPLNNANARLDFGGGSTPAPG